MPAEEAVDHAPTPTTRAVVIAGGDLGVDLPEPDGGVVIAADSGYDAAMRAGLDVDVLVGDLDSLSPAGMDHAIATDVTVERHPTDKDHTDLDLALRSAVGRGAVIIDLYGGEGGRLDHLMGGALLLTSDEFAGTRIRWHTTSGTAHVARPYTSVAIHGTPGDIVSILAPHGASGITTTGLRWQLAGASLAAGSSRGISNEITSPRCTVEVDEGTLLVIHTRSR